MKETAGESLGKLLWQKKMSGKPTGNIFFIRHGRPEVYGHTTSPLHPEGVQQVKDLALQLADGFIKRDKIAGKKTGRIIDIRYSDRPRTLQTAEILCAQLQELVTAGLLPNTIVLPLPQRPEEALSARATLGPLIDDPSIGKADAYAKWMTLPSETIHALGTRTPEDVTIGMLDFAEEARRLRNVTSVDGIDLVTLCATHETHVGAMLKALNPNALYMIPFAAVLEIYDKPEGRIYKFGDVVFQAPTQTATD